MKSQDKQRQKKATGRGVDKSKLARYAEGKRWAHARRRALRRAKDPTITVSEKSLVQEILQEAKTLRIHAGVAELVARRVSAQVANWAKTRRRVTQAELDTRVAKELSVYDPDLAFLYQNRGKII